MASKSAEINFKIVPEKLEDITASWCQHILHEGSTIDKDTTVTAVEVKALTDETSGYEDGGGFSGSTLVKLIPTYGGTTSGNEPASMVCKISGNNKRKMNFIWRLMGYAMYGPWEDGLNRHETAFYQKVAPLLADTPFKSPKVFFAALDDKGDSSLARYVIMNKPSRVRSVLVMEDLSEWKTIVVGTMLTKDEVIMCLKNIAVMHARFWGDKKKDIEEFLKLPSARNFDKEYRPAKYNSKISAWKRKRFLSSPASVKKQLDHILDGDWKAHYSMRIPKTCKLPDWFTLAPLEDGSYVAMDDPMVKEMLAVFAERLPSYNQEHLIEFSQREVETLIHGDFHGGNHKFGVDQNEGQVIVYDFQISGGSLASIEVLQALCNIEIANHSEVDSIIKEYHDTLVQNGVTDYDWPGYQLEVEKALVESNLLTISLCNSMKPKTFMKMMTTISGEEKAENMKKIFEETGWMNKFFLLLTGLYVHDKDNFLIPKKNA